MALKEINREDTNKIVMVCERGEKLGLACPDERLSTFMTIERAVVCFNINVDRWIESDDANFAHDFAGILNNVNSVTFDTVDFGDFVPRFATEN